MKNILIIENNHFQANMLKHMLERIGFESIYSSDSIQTGLSICQSQAIDIILCDIELTSIDSVSFLNKLVTIGFEGQINFISALDSKISSTIQKMNDFLSVFIGEFIQKPITEKKIIDAIFAPGPHQSHIEKKEPITISQRDIANGIKNHELINFYQPIYETRSQKLYGVEVLVRWQHPEYGLLSPYYFIEEAETSLLISDIFYLTAFNAIQDLSSIPEIGKISINVSQKTLSEEPICDWLIATCKQFNLPHHKVCIELTEGIVFVENQTVLENISRLRLNGFGLSIDDFGTGYSSLSKLASLPFTELKLDKSFIDQIEIDESIESIIQHTIQLAHSLDLNVVAEGVETQRTFGKLREFNVDFCQGYLLGKPMALEQLYLHLSNELTQSVV
ncbi:TPA: EAL domain-containing response regulator [Photobacterium damselae]